MFFLYEEYKNYMIQRSSGDKQAKDREFPEEDLQRDKIFAHHFNKEATKGSMKQSSICW